MTTTEAANWVVFRVFPHKDTEVLKRGLTLQEAEALQDKIESEDHRKFIEICEED